MKKYFVLAALLVVVNAWGFKRSCMDSSDSDYTYALTILGAQTSATMCKVYLSSYEKEFISQALSGYSDDTMITRDFYVTNIKNKYPGDTDREKALRRVVRDFGGSKKSGSEIRTTQTVGNIREMLAGDLTDITTQDAF